MDLQLFQVERAPRELPIWPLIYDDLGRPKAQRLAKVLGVSVRTARRWLASGTAPRAVCMALYWLTRWGRSQLDADAYNDATTAVALARALKRERDYLRGQVNHLKADRDAWRARLAQTLKRLEGPEAEPEVIGLKHSGGTVKAITEAPEVSKLRLPGSVTRPSRKDAADQAKATPEAPELPKMGLRTGVTRTRPKKTGAKAPEPDRNEPEQASPVLVPVAPRCAQARPLAPPAPSRAAQSAFSALVMAAVTHTPLKATESAQDTASWPDEQGHASKASAPQPQAGQKAKASGASPLYWGQAPSPPATPPKRGPKTQRGARQEVPPDHPWQRWPAK